jgi:hypothetical protein
MDKKVVILQSNYLPWKGYFELIHQADVFCFYDEVQYTKNDWRNRNRILGPNGLFWITVPVQKDAVKGKISDAQITNFAWQKKHLRTIEQTYSKSINKTDVLSLLEPIYLDQEWTSISQLNQHLIQVISKYIGITTEFKNSAKFELKGDRVDKLIYLIQQLKGTEYVSGPSAKDYLTENKGLFQSNDITLTYKKYGPYLQYNNKKKEFEDYVSILDLLMNTPNNQYIEYITSLK